MWLLLAFLSATLLGFYDVFKKAALRDNAVLPVLFLNTVFSSIIFLPFIFISFMAPQVLEGTALEIHTAGWEVHRFILLKSVIVLSSWIFGYLGMKYLPITIVGPINATRPVMVLVGAMLVFGERLNPYQWTGVLLAVASFLMLSRSGKREGIDFGHNRYILFVVLAAVMGAISGLYDKYLMKSLSPMLVQSWYCLYQVVILCPVIGLLLWREMRKEQRERTVAQFPRNESFEGETPQPTPRSGRPWHSVARHGLTGLAQALGLRWRWSIVCISLFLSSADFAYFYALSYQDSMISIVSMIRRGSVIVSFLCGALVFREKNLKSKAIDLILVLIGMFFLYLGSKS